MVHFQCSVRLFWQIKILRMSLWSHLQSFSTKPLPPTAGHVDTSVPTHSTNLHCAKQGGRRRNNCIYSDSLWESTNQFFFICFQPVQTVLCFLLAEAKEGLKNKQTQNRRFTDNSLNKLEQYKFCNQRQLGSIGKYLLWSYIARNNRMKTHTKTVSIPQDVPEGRVKLNWLEICLTSNQVHSIFQ